jgi:hypothetical protein
VAVVTADIPVAVVLKLMVAAVQGVLAEPLITVLRCTTAAAVLAARRRVAVAVIRAAPAGEAVRTVRAGVITPGIPVGDVARLAVAAVRSARLTMAPAGREAVLVAAAMGEVAVRLVPQWPLHRERSRLPILFPHLRLVRIVRPGMALAERLTRILSRHVVARESRPPT